MWIALWGAVVAVSAIVLAVLLWGLWRRFAGAARELDELGASLERLDAPADGPASADHRTDARSDVFTPWTQARLQYREDSHRRRTARSQRRMMRRRERGQPQRSDDLRAAR